MQKGPGSFYDAELEVILRKHGVGRAMALVHQPNTPVEKYEKITIGDTYAEWEITALEGLINTLDAMNEKGKLKTAKPDMPAPDLDALARLAEKHE